LILGTKLCLKLVFGLGSRLGPELRFTLGRGLEEFLGDKLCSKPETELGLKIGLVLNFPIGSIIEVKLGTALAKTLGSKLPGILVETLD